MPSDADGPPSDSDDDDGSDRIVRIELLDDDENVIGVWDRNDERG